jgi:hypothetical protein
VATIEERQRLLAVMCPHCHAAPGEPCGVTSAIRPLDGEGGRRKQRRLSITTLDGGAHDARWQAALGRPAPVLASAPRLGELRGRSFSPPQDETPQAGPAPLLAGDRPW